MIERIRNDFAYHVPPDASSAREHDMVREKCRDLALALEHLVPGGREQAIMLTKLEEVMHWANAGIAKQHPIGRSDGS